MMYEEYQDLFLGLKRNNPRNYPEVIKSYVVNMKQTVNTNQLVRLAILVSFKEEKQVMKELFEDLYRRYGTTGFEKKNLKEPDVQHICNEYMQRVEKIAKEVSDDDSR